MATITQSLRLRPHLLTSARLGAKDEARRSLQLRQCQAASTKLRQPALRDAPRTLAKRSRSLAVQAAESAAVAEAEDQPPPGCSRVTVELTRPLGIVFEERRSGGLFVAEVVAGGKAEKSGLVGVGDELISTTGVVYNSSETYGGVNVRKGMEVIKMPVRGETFDGVMAAIGSHPGTMQVTLVLQKCQQ